MVFKQFNVTKEGTKLQLNLGLWQKKDVQPLLLILALQLQNYSEVTSLGITHQDSISRSQEQRLHTLNLCYQLFLF